MTLKVKHLKAFCGFMLLETALMDSILRYAAKPEFYHAWTASLWPLLYYAPFAAMFTYALYARS